MSAGANDYVPWGRFPRHDQTAVRPRFVDELKPWLHAQNGVGGALAFGNGRSYGDSCLAAGGHLVDMRGLDRIRRFDPQTGRIECEPGLLLRDLIALTLPAGWFPAVTPGTSLATVGGAIANDVHGKNHQGMGSFGDYVLNFDLLRSTGERLTCSRAQNEDWFGATVGGLGLTGLIERVELQLKRVPGPWMDVESIRFGNLTDFFALSDVSACGNWDYTVAWIDCLARGSALGRGHFLRANHADAEGQGGRQPAERTLSVPLIPPFSLIGTTSLRAFNALYYHRQQAERGRRLEHFTTYFYPLDAIGHWNRLYGPSGFQQFQCVLPPSVAEAACRSLLDVIARSGQGSFLCVLKHMGERTAPGWLSFARPGTTLALDFPHRGERTQRLLAALDAIVLEAGGALYPAKDAHMSPDLFRQGFPRWAELERQRDPALCSAFWRRVALSD